MHKRDKKTAKKALFLATLSIDERVYNKNRLILLLTKSEY